MIENQIMSAVVLKMLENYHALFLYDEAETDQESRIGQPVAANILPWFKPQTDSEVNNQMEAQNEMKPDVVNVEHKAMETTDSSNYRHI
jgi:hypothetical protein